MFGESFCASPVITALGCLSQRGAGGGSWTNSRPIRAMLTCNFWETNRNLLAQRSEKSRRRARISFVAAICFKAWKKVPSPLQKGVNSPQVLGSPHGLTLKGCYSAARNDTLGLTAARFTLKFSLWPSQIPFLLPLNGLLLHAEHQSRLNPELLHFSC